MFGNTGSRQERENRPELIDDWLTLYGSDVWNYVFSLTRRPELTDDIVQDVFVRAYRHMDALRRRSSLRMWLLRIARNAVVDHKRSAFVRRVELTEDVDHGVYPSAEDEAVQAWTAAQIWSLALTLPMKLREVLVLYAHHQLSVAEIAGTLRISEAAVRSRLHRARQAMTQLLKEGELDG